MGKEVEALTTTIVMNITFGNIFDKCPSLNATFVSRNARTEGIRHVASVLGSLVSKQLTLADKRVSDISGPSEAPRTRNWGMSELVGISYLGGI